MSNQNINGYEIERFEIGDDDYFDIDWLDGAIYKTAKVKGIVIKDLIKTKPSGSFYNDETQIASGVNVEDAMYFQNIDFANGLTLVGGNTIKIIDGGFYNIQFSSQIVRTSGGSDQQISIWFRKNGVDVPFSNSHLNVNSNNTKMIAAWNFMLYCNVNDEIQIMFSVTSTAIQLLAEPITAIHPETPSTIVTIHKI
jgi:hypothetical protein